MTPKSEFEGWEVEGRKKTPLDQTDSTDEIKEVMRWMRVDRTVRRLSEAGRELAGQRNLEEGCREAAHHSAYGVQQLQRDPHHTTLSAEKR